MEINQEWIDQQRAMSDAANERLYSEASENAKSTIICSAFDAALDALEASMQREADKDAEIERLKTMSMGLAGKLGRMMLENNRLTSERDAAISDMIPVCCVCKHFYKKAKGVYSCHKAGDMENVYSWDNDYSCPMWEWRGLCAENAPTGGESE